MGEASYNPPMPRFRIVLAKEDFKFSAAHFTLFPGGRAELLHGHNYRVRVELAGSELDEEGQGSSPVLDRLLAFVACRAAIKAHQALAPEEMAQVLTDLAETATPYYCPHGPPIVSRIPLAEIKRELRRTW